MKPYLKLLLALALVGFCLIAGSIALAPVDEPTRAYSRLRLGMTPQEVDLALAELFNLNYKDELMCSNQLVPSQEIGVPFKTLTVSTEVYVWKTVNCSIVATYDASNGLAGAYLIRPEPPTLFQRVRKAMRL